MTQPKPESNLYHVFEDDNRSLCGKYAILFKNDSYCEPVKGIETYSKGQDCKACFKKAGLNI